MMEATDFTETHGFASNKDHYIYTADSINSLTKCLPQDFVSLCGEKTAADSF
jgi:hypothetical protein